MSNQKIDSKWYHDAFHLDMMESPWTHHTKRDIDVVINLLNLTGYEKVLDIACGYGRHSLELAKKGFTVVGVDISQELINYAKFQARELELDIDFICSDIRDLNFVNEFDVVLNLYDGAIGYLENEKENRKIFELISSALKTGGKHLMHIHSPEYAQKYFPQRAWRMTETLIELLENTWDNETNLMIETTYSIHSGDAFEKLQPVYERKRLYSLDELQLMLEALNMKILKAVRNLEEISPPSEEYNYFSVLSTKI